MIFAVRLDTFPAEKTSHTFYIGTNDQSDLAEIRRHLLVNCTTVPVAGEYLHRDAYDIAAEYGKDLFFAIERLGTHRLPVIFAAKNWVDSTVGRFGQVGEGLSDRILQRLSRLIPNHLPARMQAFRRIFEHHLMVKVSGASANEVRDYLKALQRTSGSGFFECTVEESRKAFLHRFVAASAAVRFRAVHHREVEDIVALDIALRTLNKMNEGAVNPR